MRVTVRFDEMSAQAVRTGPCPGCGRRVRRQRTFTATVSPFNQVDGRPRTPNEVQAQVGQWAREWSPDPEVFRHAGC